ncbi:hypothetical protein DV735_g3866, partial [Chaetothyriales sp. CBS 134920]
MCLPGAHDLANGTKLQGVTTTQTRSLAKIAKHFTEASGVSTALAKTEHAQGTRGFWLLKKGDSKGRYAVSCRHVWNVDNFIKKQENTEYIYKRGTGMAKLEVAWPVDMSGIKKMVHATRRYQQILLEDADKDIASADSEESHEFKDAMQRKMQAEHTLTELMHVENSIITPREKIKDRTSGYVVWSPPIAMDPQTGYKSDMAIAVSYENTHSPDDLENYIVLGDKFNHEQLNECLVGGSANPARFKYPSNGKLVFKTSVTPIATLLKGTHIDEDGMEMEETRVLKDGMATGLTMGCLDSMWGEYSVKMPDGSTHLRRELVIVGVKVNGGRYDFSGSAIVRCIGDQAELVGMLTGGQGLTTNLDITWATPAEILQRQWAAQGFYLPGKE